MDIKRTRRFDPLMMDSISTAQGPAATMGLRAIRSRGEVIDFVWDVASDAAAALLRCPADVLRGKYLCAWQDAGPPGQPRLIDRYRRILERGRTQSFDHVHAFDGRQDVVIHRVVPRDEGIAVTLTNLSANRLAQAFRLRVDNVDSSHLSHRR